MQPIKSEKLENQVSFTSLIKASPGASIRLRAIAGPWTETDRNNGISHLLEHLLAARIKSQIAKANSNSWVSAHIFNGFEAYTTKDFIELSFGIHKSDFREALNILASVITNPQFNAKDFTREKNIILAEIEENRDDIYKKINQKLESYFFGKNSLGRPILGTPAIVKKISLNSVKKFFNNIYSSQNLSLVVGGELSKADIEYAKQRFVQVSSGKASQALRPDSPIPQQSGRRHLQINSLMQAYYDRTFTIPDIRPDNIVIYRLIESILHDYLNEEIREKNGDVYSVNVEISEFHNFLTLSITFSSKTSKLKKISRKIEEALQAFSKQFSPKDFTLALDTFSKERQLDWENLGITTEELAEQSLRHSGYVIDMKTEREILEKVDRKDIIERINSCIASSGIIQTVSKHGLQG